MKDFFDLRHLPSHFEFDGVTFCRAIRATYHRRQSPLPAEPPLALTAAFGNDPSKIKQWLAFLKKGKLDADGVTLEQLCGLLHSFLMPLRSIATFRYVLACLTS
jgi:hypothetical protein